MDVVDFFPLIRALNSTQSIYSHKTLPQELAEKICRGIHWVPKESIPSDNVRMAMWSKYVWFTDNLEHWGK